MLTFSSVDWHEFPNTTTAVRGLAAIVPAAEAPADLVGQTIEVDGQLFRVREVITDDDFSDDPFIAHLDDHVALVMWNGLHDAEDRLRAEA